MDYLRVRTYTVSELILTYTVSYIHCDNNAINNSAVIINNAINKRAIDRRVINSNASNRRAINNVFINNSVNYSSCQC